MNQGCFKTPIISAPAQEDAEGSKGASEGPENKRIPKLSTGLGWKAWVNLTAAAEKREGPNRSFPRPLAPMLPRKHRVGAYLVFME